MSSPGLRARAFVLADDAHRALVDLAGVLHQGWWLGLLDHHHLDSITAIQYSRWPDYRTDRHNESGLRAWEAEVIGSHFPRNGRLLVGAAGGGREVLALSRLGYEVDAFDCAPDLVAYCRDAMPRLGARARIFLAEPGAVPDGLAQYDGVVVGWGGYMHIAGRSRRVAFLRALRSHVSSGAPLLLSFFTRQVRSRRFAWTYQIAKVLRRLRRSPDEVQLGDSLNGTFDHYFARDEMESELEGGGFSLRDYATTPYGHAIARAVD